MLAVWIYRFGLEFMEILCRHSWFPEDESYRLWWSLTSSDVRSEVKNFSKEILVPNWIHITYAWTWNLDIQHPENNIWK